jgi:very-short-patch-repair endonuclease
MPSIRNIVIGQKVSAAMVQLARQLRAQMTEEEKILWEHLRANRLHGFHFRRQQIVGKYVVDFYCHGAALVVEVDGGFHAQQVEQDTRREEDLVALDLLILRFKNAEIRRDLPNVLERVWKIRVTRFEPLAVPTV